MVATVALFSLHDRLGIDAKEGDQLPVAGEGGSPEEGEGSGHDEDVLN